jgi:hypothetical protein
MTKADIASWLITVFWCVAVIFGIAQMFRGATRSRKRTSSTTGTVVRVKMRGLNVVVPSPDVEFFDRDGIRREFKSSYGASWNPWPVGSEVKVNYDPYDPANAELASSELGTPMIVMFVVTGMILAVVGTLVVINALDRFP